LKIKIKFNCSGEIMKSWFVFAVSCCLFVCSVGAASAHEGGGEIPAKVAEEHWSVREINALAAKYGVGMPPASPGLERRRLAEQLLAIIETVMVKVAAEGGGAIPAQDLERISVLHNALHDELAQYEGYLQRRESIEKMLAKPEVPDFEYKLGVNGFLRGEGVGNFRLTDFGAVPGHGEGRFLYRVKPYVYWHPADYLDFHAEGQGYGFSGGHQEFSRYSLYQGFLETKIPGSDRVALKLGRQEFGYGSAFMLGPDSFFDGLSFDAARLRVRPAEPLTVDLLAGAYATPFSAGVKGNLAGAYLTYALGEGSAVEAYAFRDSGAIDRHRGENLQIFGGRFTTRFGPVAVEFEPVYESGRVRNAVLGRNDRIDAFGGHLDFSHEATIGGYNNKFFASYAYGSGSRDAANGISAAGEFRNPNNDNSLVGDMNVVGDLSGVTASGHHASGLRIHTLGWGVDLTRELNFSATGRYFLANNVERSFSRTLGLETDFTLTYALNDGFTVMAGYDRFFTGGFFRDATGSGKDIHYGYLMVQFDLFASKPKLKPAKG
jgi:hypothetical protein